MQSRVINVARYSTSMTRTKKGGRRKAQQKRTKEEWEQFKKDNPREDGYVLAPKKNLLFEKFYSGIGIVPEEEMETFLETAEKALPITFRITGSRNQAKELLKIIQGQYFNSLVDAEKSTGAKIESKCLKWYPDELAWQLDFTKRELKQSEEWKKLHQFLISETESGNISRQEAVSMLPPLLMDIKPHHKILDMCAAPGSKTAQLIEFLHSDESVTVPDGFVVANDMDNKRCYLMTHQVKRIQSPNCMIINHDARCLPNLKIFSENPAERVIKYDRVLCDVPCSGDGTLRKNPDIWGRWNVSMAFNLHKVQKKVLQRGLELLAVGGKLVYSTCSMNPIEDEAVIMELIKKCGGAIELVDVSDQLPNLKYQKGLHTWRLLDKNGDWYETFEQTPEVFQKRFERTMFAPLLPEAHAANLERCVRVLPHYQDTGGFFIAVLQKTAELPWVTSRTPKETANSSVTESASASGDTSVAMETNNSTSVDGTGDQSTEIKESEENQTEADPECSEPPCKIPRTEQKTVVKLRGYKEDPFLFCDPDDPLWPPVKKFYEISDDFNVAQLMYRNKKRILYYVSKKIASIVKWNSDKVKFINLGVKCFSNAPSPIVPDCDFRLGQEGLHVVQHFIKGRRVPMAREDMVTILSEENPFNFKLSAAAQEYVYKLDPGSVIFEYKPTESNAQPNCQIAFCGWRGKTSVRSFVSRDERSHYLRLFGVELSDVKIRITMDKEVKPDAGSQPDSVAPSSGDEEQMKKWMEKEAPRSTEEEENCPTENEEEKTPKADMVYVTMEIGQSSKSDGTDTKDEKISDNSETVSADIKETEKIVKTDNTGVNNEMKLDSTDEKKEASSSSSQKQEANAEENGKKGNK